MGLGQHSPAQGRDTEDVELIRYLLERGAARTIGDARWGETPYDWAGYYDNDAMRKALGASDAATKEAKQ